MPRQPTPTATSADWRAWSSRQQSAARMAAIGMCAVRLHCLIRSARSRRGLACSGYRCTLHVSRIPVGGFNRWAIFYARKFATPGGEGWQRSSSPCRHARTCARACTSARACTCGGACRTVADCAMLCLRRAAARATWLLVNEQTEQKVLYVAACCTCWCLIAIALAGAAAPAYAQAGGTSRRPCCRGAGRGCLSSSIPSLPSLCIAPREPNAGLTRRPGWWLAGSAPVVHECCAIRREGENMIGVYSAVRPRLAHARERRGAQRSAALIFGEAARRKRA